MVGNCLWCFIPPVLSQSEFKVEWIDNFIILFYIPALFF